jgi:hypothetical protein
MSEPFEPLEPLPEAIELESWPAWHDWLHRTCDVLQTIALVLIAIALIAD